MKVRSGHVPTDIMYIYGASQEVNTTCWDDVEETEEEKAAIKKEQVIPAFVSDADNPKTITTGERWARNHCRRYNHQTQKYEEIATVSKVSRENKPISGIRVVSLEHRGEGGRAYKVITPDGYYFDLREDILLDVMRSVGISPGGVLNGEYVWARIGGSMKLVRVGSALYDALLDAGERAILRPIPKTKLTPGSVYETKAGAKFIYFGKASTVYYHLEWVRDESVGYWHGNQHKCKVQAHPIKNQMFWYQLNDNSLKTPEKILADLYQMMNEGYSYHFDFKATHSVVRKVTDVDLPDDIFQQLREAFLAAYHKDEQGRITLNQSMRNPRPYHQAQNLSTHSRLIFIQPGDVDNIDTNISEFEEINKYIGQFCPEQL